MIFYVKERGIYLKNLCITVKIDLLFLVLIFKTISELGYKILLTKDAVTYPDIFNIIKYVNGLFWCIVLFLFIRHDKKRMSTFAVFLIYFLQIIPITVVYALSDENAIFYNWLCCVFFVFEIIVGWGKEKKFFFSQSKKISKYVIPVGVLIIIVVIYQTYIMNGIPSLIALNIWDVYKLRLSGIFRQTKYIGYLREWMMEIICPFLLSVSILKKRRIMTVMLCFVELLIYLYTGLKGYLFGIPLIIVCTLWSKRKNFYKEFVRMSLAGMSFITSIAIIINNAESISYKIYSLFVRRVMMVSAINKFSYFDYFSKHQRMGLYGAIPRILLPSTSIYEGKRIGMIIAGEYYNKPEMNSNTGFIAEGYMRFGIMGILLVFLILACFLHMMDNMQERTSYPLVIGTFTYSIYLLGDGHLFDLLFFGTWMIIFLISMFYTPNKDEFEDIIKKQKRRKIVLRRI